MYGGTLASSALIRKLNINRYPKGISTYLTNPNFARIFWGFSQNFGEVWHPHTHALLDAVKILGTIPDYHLAFLSEKVS